MNHKIIRCLRCLYGESSAKAVEAKVALALNDFRARPGCQAAQGRGPLGLTQRDALLITYADQVREPDAKPLQTLAEFCKRHLKGIISGVHILPFYPWSSDDGFSVKDFFSVEPSYGTWDDIGVLGAHFDLMFDAVFNHVSAQGEWFQRFLAEDPIYRDFFISVTNKPNLSQVVRPRAQPLLTEFATEKGTKTVWTTFGPDQADLNFKNPNVLLAALEALLFYARQGARFVRLDAIAFLWKEIGTSCLHLPQTHRVIQFLRAVLDETAPHVLLVSETNVPHSENISYFGDGSNEAQLVYNFALPPLALHALQTGNADKLTRWAQSLSPPSSRVAFFNFLASHDGIGLNPAHGILSDDEIRALARRATGHHGLISYKNMADGSRPPYELNINYLDALSNPIENEPADVAARKFLTAHAILLCLQGMPGIYFHSLFGSRGDRDGAETSGILRRINRQKLDRVRLEAELCSKGSLRALVWNGLRELLHVRQQHSAFAPPAPQHVLELDPRLFVLLRQSQDGKDAVLCIQNVSAEAVTLALHKILPANQEWKPIWGLGANLDAIRSVKMHAHSGIWLAPTSPAGEKNEN